MNLKDFLIKNNIDYKEVISLYLFIEEINSDITEFHETHGQYDTYPEHILNELDSAEEKFEEYKNIYKKEYPESNFENEVYDLFCDYLENKVEDIKAIKTNLTSM